MPTAINGINTTTDTTPTTADPLGNAALGEGDFLKLLMAQLQNQDPTAPQDDTQMIAQLAQFSALEAAQGTNSRLDTLLLAQTNQTQTEYVNFIGKDVAYRTDTLDHTQGLSDVSQVTLGGAAAKVTVTIQDASGNVVRTMNLGSEPAGAVQVVWDGNNDSGTPQPSGSYTMKVAASDAAGAPVATDLTAKGPVTGVTYSNGIPMLSVNGTPIKMSEITSISERSTQ
ncbi:MAG TPA: flagellar hook assembly protein FlgD [Polyangia bacterium]|nr:flagellar hook assembly protein FlgD [Polyangia bacterium]